jgi:hypothetical protein
MLEGCRERSRRNNDEEKSSIDTVQLYDYAQLDHAQRGVHVQGAHRGTPAKATYATP